MRPETFTLSQKELQRVRVISTCIKGDLACAAPRRPWLAPQTPRSRSSPAPSVLPSRRRTPATRWQPSRLTTGSKVAAQFFPAETTAGYFRLLQRLLRRCGVPTAFYGDRSGIFVRNDPRWSLEEELAGQRQPTQFGRAPAQLGITFIAA